ncbi:ERF family protein [Nocardia terpenica]|uniref:ERF family protein n=1 Tax=Nocardia terpenica TaxID=455432 RepID=UPI001895A9E3|nr:ERF family protein [Nocardia terpenica]MBF6063036.1 ERF family protein [Nocardia terpenica]MBF6104829.1 ERF family protein [Nocardia terpenica]MBF6112735.1 ERF family protein [Nocardia terpenica]MBF6118557.1 ERF family protein [Nocardia terpenica]MBF6155036.1 ERF family protein [Nocardia terpenica]
MKIHEAIIEVKASIGAVGKNQQNNQQRYRFRGVDDVINAVSPALNSFGVIVRPIATELAVAEVPTAGGKRQAWVTGTVTYRFQGPEGDFLDAEVATEAMDLSDKATAKAMSVAYRIVMVQTFNLPTDEPDPDAAYLERGTDQADEIRAHILRACEARSMTPEELRTIFGAVGGTGKFSECTDAVVLERVLARIEPPQ